MRHMNIRNAQHRKKVSVQVGKRAYYMSTMSFAVAFAMLALPIVAFASQKGGGAQAVTNSFNSLKEIVVALVSSIGTIVLLWGFFEWGTSMQSTDGVMQSSAFKRIGGGLIMVLAPQLISAFVG